MKTKWRAWQRSPQNTWLQVDYLCTDGFNLEILQCGLSATSTFDKWHDIRCLRAEFTAKHGKAPSSLTTRWWMEPGWAHDSRPIYLALTYIVVPLLGPHQPQYIGLTLYKHKTVIRPSYLIMRIPIQVRHHLYIESAPIFLPLQCSFLWGVCRCGFPAVVHLRDSITLGLGIRQEPWFASGAAGSQKYCWE